MNQIIVNVSGLSVGEKHRVNKALAKITGFKKSTSNLVTANWMYAPSLYTDDVITYSDGNESNENKEPTHTPQQVLEMAGMETSADQHVFLADKFIITDSSGRIIYDGTSGSISTFIKSRASAGKDGSLPSRGFSVKTDENGEAIMAENRKVRKDFDPKQPISVDVSNCTEDEKKEVQQAFYDVGIKWFTHGSEFRYLDAGMYTNSTSTGMCHGNLMYGISPRTDSISHQQFLELVYEAEQRGHVHAETPTHTPQQALEMADMTTERKVRKDFDPSKDYSVDVSNCTKEVKKEVQQAFFDVGFPWKCGGEEYQHLDVVQYSNTYNDGTASAYCLYGVTTKEANMTPEEFLELVYEPEQQGHIHADLMALYSEDAKTTDKPWELWQVHYTRDVWHNLAGNPNWSSKYKFRRKPKTHTVNGEEIPDLRFVPKEGELYWSPDPRTDKLAYGTSYWLTSALDKHRISNKLCYEYTDAGKQAAILHAKAWLGIA